MSLELRKMTPEELHLLSYMFVYCGAWELADQLAMLSGYYAESWRNPETNQPCPGLVHAQESFRFAADNIESEYDLRGICSADTSHVLGDLEAIVREHKPKPFDYHAYLRSPEWKAKRDAQVDVAGGRCQVCNSSKQLNCHHRTYERIGDEIPGDLFVLCADCHQIFHDNGRLARPSESSR